MVKRLIGLFIIFSPFTSYFAVSPWLRFPVLLLLVVYAVSFVKIILRRKIERILFSAMSISDLILLSVLTCGIISSLLNFSGVNHLLAYGFTFIMYFLLLKKIIAYEKIDYFFMLKMFATSAFICGIIIIADWFLINLFSVGFREYFVTVDHKTANMLYYQKGFFLTVGGVAEEPESMALLMNIMSPLGMLYYKMKKSYWRYLSLFFIYLLSSFFLFSTAGIVASFGSFILISIVNFFSENRLRIKRNTLLIFSIVLTFIVFSGIYFAIKHFDTIKAQMTEIANKISLSEHDASADLRTDTWEKALLNWSKSPLWGNGPGDGVKRYGSGYHSVYLTILADIGIVAIILFFCFLFLEFRKIFKLPKRYRNYLVIAFLSTVIHFSVIGDFYHAPFWILLIVIGKMVESQNSTVSQ